MLNPAQKINPKLYELGVEQISNRDGFGEGLIIAADEDPNVVALCADLTESVKMLGFAEKYPERYVELGVAEQNMAGVASGMAAMGKIPFMASYAAFSPGRNWEQIRTTICYNNQPVKIIGSHTGVSVGADGGSHQALEDIALMRVLPNMQVIVPCDAIEAIKATVAAAQTKSPTYIRLSRDKTPVVTTDDSPFEIGEANLLINPKEGDVGIIACGPLVYQALLAAKKLEADKVSAYVLNLHTIKPLDDESIVALAKSAGALVTVEDHQLFGGMGSAVAEVIATKLPVPIEMVGVADKFGQSGDPGDLLDHYGLSVGDIVAAAKRAIKRKKSA